MSPSNDTPLPAYREWLEARIEARRERFPDLPGPRQFSVVTAAWNTNPGLLRECAESVLEQDGGENVEWLVIDNGSTNAETVALLDDLATRSQVRLIRLPHNLGILGALRLGLESASGQYVLPLDHDDVLVRDCLRVLATTVRERGRPAFIFSDEDLLIEGEPRHPYLRPDFDPLLNLSSSYVWHVTAIRRDVALACDLYRDRESEYCQDWDTVMRVWQAGHPLVHVPEVLYHWRQHPESSTGKADPAAGSIKSVRHVLGRFVARQPRPELYRIEDFPIFRGARELYVLRNEFAAEPLDLMIVGGDPAAVGRLLDSVLETWRYPMREICVWSAAELDLAALQGFHGVLESAANRAGISTHPRLFHNCPFSVARDALQSPVCAVLSQDVVARGAGTPWEALKHFELFPEVVAMGGRVLDSAQVVREAGAVATPDGRPHAVFTGLPEAGAGPFAMALKPQLVDQPSLDAFFVRREFLAQVDVTGAGAASVGAAVARAAHSSGSRAGMSPLIGFTLQEGARPQRETLSPDQLMLPPGAERRLSEWGFVAEAGLYR